MKTSEMAFLTLKHPCNNSSAKSQFTFSRQPRFHDRQALAATLSHKYYDLPSQLSKHSFTFARAEPSTRNNHQTPSPGRYQLK
jgi:hypothetical protein